MLEENLARLQARLQELENPEAARPVLLSDPYSAPGPAEGFGLPERRSPPSPSWWDYEEPPAQMRDMLYVLTKHYRGGYANDNIVSTFSLPMHPLLGLRSLLRDSALGLRCLCFTRQGRIRPSFKPWSCGRCISLISPISLSTRTRTYSARCSACKMCSGPQISPST